MHFLKQALEKKPLSAQLRENAALLLPLKKLLRGRDFQSIRGDYDLFRRLNEMMGGGAAEPAAAPDLGRIVDTAKGELNFAINVKKVKPFKTFCEVGCGLGAFPRAAFEMGCELSHGLDLRPYPQWEDFRRDANSRLEFFVRDIGEKKEETPGLQYDLVTSFSAFEHFKNPPQMLAAMAALVAEGGFLYANFSPIFNAPFGYHTSDVRVAIRVPWHHLIFSRRVLRRYYDEHDMCNLIKSNDEWLNRWSALDFMNMFANFTGLRLMSLQPFWDLRFYWFARLFPQILPPGLGLEELIINGFRVIYRRD
ncbi:hypothetical protein C4J81_18840 (plasmid) [Deltaproteobacteria bacterium Smac51]|nr:hypothetical protein C4J81_18840 [Deltaproteobacteria bacterium Smac51]